MEDTTVYFPQDRRQRNRTSIIDFFPIVVVNAHIFPIGYQIAIHPILQA